MYKFCTSSCVIGWRGQEFNLHANTVWLADDPFVKAHPDLFADAPERVEASTGIILRGVEQATAAPGEKRGR